MQLILLLLRLHYAGSWDSLSWRPGCISGEKGTCQHICLGDKHDGAYPAYVMARRSQTSSRYTLARLSETRLGLALPASV